jgi:hypothetical protein
MHIDIYIYIYIYISISMHIYMFIHIYVGTLFADFATGGYSETTLFTDLHLANTPLAEYQVLQSYVAVHCNRLQCVAVCCTVCIAIPLAEYQVLPSFVAVCCSVFRIVTVCCSVLKNVSVCCSLLQRVYFHPPCRISGTAWIC